MEEANKLIGTGKKHLVMGKVVEAVSTLQEACGMLAKKFGDTADECGEAFFWYGKALLDLARMENSVLGNALEGVPEEEEEEKPKDSNVESTENVDEKTRDELRVQVYDAMAEKKTEDGEKVEGKQSEDPQEKTEGAEAGDEKEKTEKVEGEAEKDSKNDESKSESEDKKETSGEEVDAKDDSEPAAKQKEGDSADAKEEKEEDSTAEKDKTSAKEEEAAAEEEGDGEEDEEEGGDDVEMEGDAEEQGEGDSTGEKDSDDEEVGHLQLAWEMLEVAKVIYKRKEAKEDQLMAAQAHLKLGEVSAESGNYPQALEDFQECLKLQVKHLDSDSRLLAETHYQLGVTYSLNTQYSEAIESLKSSISIIKNRLDKLQEMLDKAEGPEALPEERKELEELKALLPEIQEKVEDATESLKTASTASVAVKDALDGGSTSSAFDGSTVQNSDSSSTSEIKSTSTSNGNTSTAPVSDISHLVRKKRKPEESPVKEDVKKVKQDNSQLGETPLANGDAGGHANDMEVESK
ncbi:histone-binding protein N1/N2 [Oreochromis niloticus]|uniref:histone-binding protein N1/N2 n=1 Tax=Oreochromis niloticus TaxID=8128 RepID=UPI00022B3FE3|nr:histone-binding protein N1/N2 [Oreochromis niloticus]CAI5641825.1 unnamed protein product [Mustela putorius furo]